MFLLVVVTHQLDIQCLCAIFHLLLDIPLVKNISEACHTFAINVIQTSAQDSAQCCGVLPLPPRGHEREVWVEI